MANKTNVLKYKKRNQPKFIRIIFVLIIIYIVFLFFNYMNKEHISIYEVNETKIADDTTLKGVILRKELVFTTEQAGFVNYFNPEGNRIGVGTVVYTLDETGHVASTLAGMDKSAEMSKEDIASFRNVIAKYQNNLNLAQFGKVYDYQYAIKNTILEQSQDNLYSDLEKVLSETGESNSFQKVTAKKSGIISYSIDGFEELKAENVNSETFKQELTMNRQQLRTTNTVIANSPVYRLITSEDWQMVVPLTEEYYEKMKDKSVIRVKVKKDNVSFNADLEIQQKEDGFYALLSMSRFAQRYMNDRFLELELNVNSAEGLKIPNTSIVKEELYCIDASYAITTSEGSGKVLAKEVVKDNKTEITYINLSNAILINDKYYLRKDVITAGDILYNPTTNEKLTVSTTEKLEGVYCVNEGYCKFVRVEKKYENAEYTIVSSETPGGLAVFDHIVVNPKTLNENDFIQ